MWGPSTSTFLLLSWIFENVHLSNPRNTNTTNEKNRQRRGWDSFLSQSIKKESTYDFDFLLFFLVSFLCVFVLFDYLVPFCVVKKNIEREKKKKYKNPWGVSFSFMSIIWNLMVSFFIAINLPSMRYYTTMTSTRERVQTSNLFLVFLFLF